MTQRRAAPAYTQASTTMAPYSAAAVPTWPDGKLWVGTRPGSRIFTGGRCRGSRWVPTK